MEKEPIVVDANIIISALIGGESRKVLLNEDYNFITTEFTIKEVKKYLPLISKKSGVPLTAIGFALHLLPITIFDKEAYKDKIPLAKDLIKDPKDAEILALTLAMNKKLWSHDKHFRNITKITLLNTRDFSA